MHRRQQHCLLTLLRLRVSRPCRRHDHTSALCTPRLPSHAPCVPSYTPCVPSYTHVRPLHSYPWACPPCNVLPVRSGQKQVSACSATKDTVCESCPASCNTCDGGVCTECLGGTYLLRKPPGGASPTCTTTCPDGYVGLGIDPVGRVCEVSSTRETSPHLPPLFLSLPHTPPPTYMHAPATQVLGRVVLTTRCHNTVTCMQTAL